MASFYRYTNVVTNPKDVKDMQLSTSYGDLSDGASTVIRINPGVVGSNIGLFQFPIANSYRFGDPGQITGFNFRFKTVSDERGDTANLQGTRTFSDYCVFMHKQRTAFEGNVEGDVMQLGENTAYTMHAQHTANPSDQWYPMDLGAYLTTMDYAYPAYLGMYEDFEGVSDVDTTIEVTQGAVRKKGDPYITLDVAQESAARQAAGSRMSKMEMKVFYGSTFKGTEIVKLKKKGKTWGPLDKKGKGGLGPAWNSALGIGGDQSDPNSELASGVKAPTNVLAPIGTFLANNPTNKNFTSQGYALGGKVGKYVPYLAGKSIPGANYGQAAMNSFNKWTKGTFATGTAGKGAKFVKAGSRKIPIVGTVITAATTLLDVKKRGESLRGAIASGDASGLSRPMRDPVWYSKASWKNKHVGEKSIGDKIKYSYETILNPLEQKDSQAITTTSTWWDQVRERQDYPKSEVTTDGKEISYVGSETMAAKTSINFHTGDSVSGQSMEMRAYADFDANQLCRNQEAFHYGTGTSPEQQDIFVSKRLPCPKTMFGDRDDAGAPSLADGARGNKWELTLDLKIANGWTPYTMSYHGAGGYRNTMKRTIAITFGTKKPKDNDDLQSYLKSFTDGAGTFDDGKVTGVYWMPSMDYANGVAGDMMINPMSTIYWNDPNVLQYDNLQYGLLTFGNGNLAQTSMTNGEFGCKFPTGKFIRLKFHTSPQGASGCLANTGSKAAKAGHQGRFWLTLHDPETDDIMEPRDVDDSDDKGLGTTKAGPIVLSAFGDYEHTVTDGVSDTFDGYTNNLSKSNYATNLGKNDGTEGTHAKWLPYFTIWVCNHRFNTTASKLFTSNKVDGNLTADNPFKHDIYQKAAIKEDQATSLDALVPDTVYGNANLSDMRLLVDQIALKGVEPDVVNMSVCSENTSSGQQNMLNAKGSKFPRYYDVDAGSSHSYFYQDQQGTPSFSTDQKDVKTLNQMPTILSLGFTKAGATNWNKNNVNEGSGNYGECTTDKPTFLLFNDFVCSKTIPNAIPDVSLAAMYTASSERDRLCGDPIDVLGKLGSATSKNPFNSTGDGNLSIGNTAGNDICTGNAETDVWDRNRSTSHKMYVNNFQGKGFLQVQKNMINSEGADTENGWMRRENVYASTHVLKATDITSKKATLTVSQDDVLFRNTVDDDNLDTGHDLFILYQYGRPLSFDTAVVGTNGVTKGTVAVGTIERDENQVIFTKVEAHSTQNLNDEWVAYTATHDGTGGDLEVILNEANLPRCMISPYRKWMCIQVGQGPSGATVANGEALEDLEPRGYGSIVPVKRPRVAGTDATYGGFAQGPTFNESRWYVNSSDQNPYYSKASYDIQEPTTAYHTDLDFGNGAYDMETGIGGQVTNFRPDYNRNVVDMSNLLNGASDLAEARGKPISFIISAATGLTEENDLYIHSSQTANNEDKPKFVTEFFDPIPANPGLVINQFEDDPHHPQFDFAIDGDDIWHTFLMVDDKPITGKFHNMIAYAPLNENLDTWSANVTYDPAITPKQIKCFNHADFIDKDFIGETSASALFGKLSYATDDGLYNGAAQMAYTADTCEGLNGHAKIGGLEFLYGLRPGTVDDGYELNTETDYRKHFTAQGIFTANSAMGTDKYTMLGAGSTTTSPSWIVYYDGTTKQVVVRIYWSGTEYVELKSTSSLPLDDITPTHVAIVLDTEILEANAKLYINGILEDQTGKALATGTTNNWEWGEVLLDAGSYFCIGSPIGTIPEGSLATIAWTGKVEECIVHKCPLYFFPDGVESFVYTKQLEEVTNSLSGEAKSYHARLFAMDYHNIRFPVAQSKNQSWKIPSFNIDGT